MELDHLILAVADLDAAAAQLTHQTGLAVLPGGTHPDWGTANRIVPLGGPYLELVTVIDPDRAAATAFGRMVTDGAAGLTGGSSRLSGWAVSTTAIDQAAARTGAPPPRRGRRQLPDGGQLTWTIAADETALPRGLPFFVRWDDPTASPGHQPAPHKDKPAGVAWLEVGGDQEELHRWLGRHDLPLRAVTHPAGPHRAAIALAEGTEPIIVGASDAG